MENLAWSNGDKAVRSKKGERPIVEEKIEDNKVRNSYVERNRGVNEDKHPTGPAIDSGNLGTHTAAGAYNAAGAYTAAGAYNVAGDYKLSGMETINTFDMTDNRREIYNDKLSNRTAISNACGNPFLTHLKYSDDIIQQERFLIPKNSNMEKEYCG